MQELEPGADDCPALQTEHEPEPLDELNVPAEQGLQEADPIEALSPGRQAVHELDPSLDEKPAGQGEHAFEAAVDEYFPGAQEEQPLEAENSPGWH